MTNPDLFRKLSLSQVAKELDVLPFYIARYLGQKDGLPVDLRFDREEVEILRNEMGLKAWWKGENFEITDTIPARRLIREMANRMLKMDFSKTERADNLFRGLQGANQRLITQAVNELIKMGVIQSVPLASGLGVRFVESKKTVLEKIAGGEEIPKVIERLWT